ncbi:MAG TPA: alcohol dehydrogenase catalytic domain-containing protein, partial [Longimicrobiales bacterium]
MRAVRITRFGPPEVLQLDDVVTPAPGARHVLVRVHAAGVNRADLIQRRGFYPAPPGFPEDIPGLEYAGEVTALGEAARRWQVGDRVMGLVGGGGYAEYVVVHEDEAISIPDTLSYEQAAAVPEAFLTAYDALHARLHVQHGESVLIHAVASGVGIAAAQLARQLDCFVIGTARSQWKLDRVAQ